MVISISHNPAKRVLSNEIGEKESKMIPHDRWKEIENILNTAFTKEETELLIKLLKETVRYEALKIIKE